MLKRLTLRDVGPAAELEIVLAPRVNVITGDNGLGKSFLLDIAWWALTRTWAHYPALPNRGQHVKPSIGYEFEGKQHKDVAFDSGFDWESQAWISKPGRPPNPGLVLYAQADGSFSVWDPARNYYKKAASRGVDAPDRPPAYLFSPPEVWDGFERPDPKDASRTEVLCNGLIRDWASWQKERGSAHEQLRRVLERLSPPEGILQPGPLTRISLDDVRDMPTITTPYGKDVALVHASAAVRRIVALAYLLVWTWQEHIRASALLNQAPAQQVIFLVDEIDAHMHPAWQRRILPSLLEVIRALTDDERIDVQIITVTHSPMLLASMEPIFDVTRDALWRFDLVSAGAQRDVQLLKHPWQRRGDASAWLRSEVFALEEARSEEAERALAEARAVMAGAPPAPAEFNRIYDSLRRSMPGADPFWIDWRTWAWRQGLLGDTKA